MILRYNLKYIFKNFISKQYLNFTLYKYDIMLCFFKPKISIGTHTELDFDVFDAKTIMFSL